jgi:hypothetical protein
LLREIFISVAHAIRVRGVNAGTVYPFSGHRFPGDKVTVYLSLNRNSDELSKLSPNFVEFRVSL